MILIESGLCRCEAHSNVLSRDGIILPIAYGLIKSYAPNMIVKDMYAQVDSEGNRFL